MSDDKRQQEERLLTTWASPTGFARLSDVNNTVIGVWYIALTLAFFLFGGVLAVLMRLQLAFPDSQLVPSHLYSQLFTMHGSIMMFLFAVPIFEAISIVLMPQILGARDLPFPRLSAFGFWSFAIGGTFFCATLFFGLSPSGGWFMYPPLTTEQYQPGFGADVWLLGLSFIEVSAIAAAVELVVGVLRVRPPGMGLNVLPLYAWYVLVVAIMLLFAFPPLIAGTMLLELERAFHWPFFDPERGGDPILWQHLFWIFGHPEVYIVFLPSIALIATILPTFTRTPIVGHRWVVLSTVATGFLSFGLWVHHMFTTGLPGISLGLFSAASMAVSIPTAIQFACFGATLLVGRPVMNVPMLFSLAGLTIFVLGGFTGVMVAVVPFDLQAHDTHFIVAHLHTVLLAGTVFPILGGLWYWFPMVSGRMLSERVGKVAFWLVVVGFCVTFLPMHWTGLRGMPRRVFTYPEGIGLDVLNLVSTCGALVLAAGIVVIAVEVLRPGKVMARRDPWKAGTIEWLTEINPDRPWGVRSVPRIETRYPLWEQPGLMEDVDEGRGYLPDAEEGLRETIVTTPIDGRPLQVQRVAPPSWYPFMAAFGVGGFFIFSTFRVYPVAMTSAVFATVVILAWLWTGTAHIPEKPAKDCRHGLVLPLYLSGPSSLGWWGLFVTMMAFLTAFLSLLFGYFFYWAVHPQFPPDDFGHPDPGWLAAGALAMVGALGLVALAIRLNRRGRGGAYHLSLLGAAALTVGGSAAFLAAPIGMSPTEHVYPAIVWIIVIWPVLLSYPGLLMHGYCIARRLAGRLTPTYDMDLHNVLLFWGFNASMAVLGAVVLAGFPWLT